jgi:hypothetical protein
MIDLGQVYGDAAQIQGARQRNELLEMMAPLKVEGAQLRNEAQGQRNRLAELTMDDQVQQTQQQTQMGDMKLTDAQRQQAIYESQLFMRNLGQDFSSLPPEQQQRRWMAARQQAIELDPDDAALPEQFDPTAYRNIASTASMTGDTKQTSFENKLINAGYTPGTPEYQEAARKLLYKPSGTTVNVGTGGGPADAFDKAFGDSGEGRRLAIQARALARKEGISATDAIERVALQKDVTSGERAADTYYQRMTDVSQDIEAMEDQGYNPSAPDAILSKMPGGNFLVGNDYQQYQAMANEWIRAKLRKESGAAIPPEEMQGEFRTYFFVPGDSPETIRRKRQLRTQAREAMAGERSRLDAVGGQGGNQTANWDDL